MLAVLRKRGLRDDVGHVRLGAAVDDLLDLPIERQPISRRIRRARELRANSPPYGAVYVALAEALNCVLLTADRRLAAATGVRATVQIVTQQR